MFLQNKDKLHEIFWRFFFKIHLGYVWFPEKSKKRKTIYIKIPNTIKINLNLYIFKLFNFIILDKNK